MFNFLNIFRKESAAVYTQLQFLRGQAVWTPRKYEALAEEGYQYNVIAYRCINMIAKAVASVTWEVRRGDEVIPNHPALALLKRPNPRLGGADFITEVVCYLKIAGNSYLEAVEGGGTIQELYALQPDRMKVIAGEKALVKAYEYEANGMKYRWEVDQDTGDSLIYHWKEFHPLNDWYGMAPIEAGAYAIDQHNEAGRWNKALLQNAARPSGAMIYEQSPGDEALQKVKDALLDRMAGAANAGLPLVLGGKAKWEEMGKTPREMDFNNSVMAAGRDICNAFGVPHELVIPGQSTYRNKEEARLMFWEDTIIPLLDSFVEGPGEWVVGKTEAGRPNSDTLDLSYNLDDVAALAPRRRYRREAVTREYQAGIITLDEAREELGRSPMPEQEKPTEKPKPGSDEKSISTKDLPLGDLVSVDSAIEEPSLFADIERMLSSVFGLLTEQYGERVVKEIGERLVFERDADVEDFVRTTTANEVRLVNGSTKKQLRQIFTTATAERWDYAQTTAAIVEKFDKWSLGRATNIAVTESTRIAGFASLAAIKQSGIGRKEWLTTLDGNERESHNILDGEISDVDGYFESESGAKAQHPGGFGVASEDINCRCTVIAAFDQKDRQPSREEKAHIWQKREDFRLIVEGAIFKAWQTIFEMQKAAIIDRLIGISETQGSFIDESQPDY